MATPAQIDANRRNAQHSTGPRTPEGKERSRLNALRHGLAAQSALLPGEDPADLDALARRMREAHRPAPGLEEVLVERLVALAWKLRRTGGAEQALSEKLELQEHAKWRHRMEGHTQTGGLISHPGDPPWPREADEILADEFFNEDSPMLRLAAYEARLTSQLLGTARQLEKLQKARADARDVIPEDEPPAQNEPIVVDDERQPDATAPEAASTPDPAEPVARGEPPDPAPPAQSAHPATRGAERTHCAEDASGPDASEGAPEPPDPAANPATRRPGGRWLGPLS